MMRTWLCLARGGSVLLFAIALLFAQETTTVAQERPQPEAQDGSSVFALPDWAEPQNHASDDPGSVQRPPEEFRTQDEGPTPPPIPIGGLEWLIAAGAGYGLWKLRAAGGSASNEL